MEFHYKKNPTGFSSDTSVSIQKKPSRLANTEIEPTKLEVMKQSYCSDRKTQKIYFDNSSSLNEECCFRYDLIPLCKSSNQPPYVYYFFLH